jgi:hypothetical protein
MDWFAAVELNAWTAIDTYFHDSRPEKIFLIKGQTLTDEWAISHGDQGTASCEFSIEAGGDLPGFIRGHASLGHFVHKVTASSGFREMKRDSPDEPRYYSVFVEVMESKPLKRFQTKSFHARIDVMKRYLSIVVRRC